MATYLQLFEEVVRAEAREMGTDAAYCQARSAGLEVSNDGHVLGYREDPQLVLLRLLRGFTSSGSMPALAACTPLINEMLRQYDVDDNAVRPRRISHNATGKIRTKGASSGEA